LGNRYYGDMGHPSLKYVLCIDDFRIENYDMHFIILYCDIWFAYMWPKYSDSQKSIKPYVEKMHALVDIHTEHAKDRGHVRHQFPPKNSIHNYYFFNFFYSSVHTMIGSLLPLSPHPPSSLHPLTSKQILFCPYL
jgi:hypothetical protein